MKIKFTDILPNPFRDFSVNPINKEKVAELVASINETGFWDNVVVRPSPKHKGKYELAYGHHRFEAAKESGLKEADFIVKNFSDALMIKVMKNDNMEFGYNVLGYIESVQAVVKSVASGAIEFTIAEDTPKTAIRYAPSYAPGGEPSNKLLPRPYTALDVAKFLGYTQDKQSGLRADNNVQAALRALYLIEAGVYTIEFLRKQEWNTAQLLKNTQDAWDRLMETRKREAQKAKDEAVRAKIEAERKAFEAEQKAKHEAAQAKIKEAEEAKRKAEREEKVKEIKAADERRQKAVEDEVIRLLKAHKENARKKLDKFGAPTVAVGVTVEKAVKEAESAIASRDVKEAEKLTTVLQKATEKITEAAKKTFVEKAKTLPAPQVKEPEREPSIRVKRLAAKFYSMMFEGDVSAGIESDPNLGMVRGLIADKSTTLKERDILFQAMKNAATRIDHWADKLRPNKMPTSVKSYTILKAKGAKK